MAVWVERVDLPLVEVVAVVDEAAVALVERELVGAVVALSDFVVLLVDAGVRFVEEVELLLVERAEAPLVELALVLVAVLVEAEVLPDVVVLFVSSLAAALFTSLRNWPALRTDTPFVLLAVRVTRCSNESFGCCVA